MRKKNSKLLYTYTIVWFFTLKARTAESVHFLFAKNVPEEKIITPTLLSVANENEWIDALSHPLYERLLHKSSIFMEHGLRQGTEAQIWIDKQEISFSDSITVSISGANDDDIVALYCPGEQANAKEFLEVATLHQIKRMGSISREDAVVHWNIPSFPVIREDTCEFRLWRPPPRNENSSLLSTFRDLHVFYPEARTGRFRLLKSKTKPTGIHLSLTASPNEMRVHFTTGYEGTPLVQYKDQNGGSTIQKGSSQTYRAEDMCSAPANQKEPGKFSDPGMLHLVELQGLSSDTEYAYKVGLQLHEDQPLEEIHWSDEHTFTSPPQTIDPSSYSFSFLVYGDQGCPEAGWEGGYTAVTQMAKHEVKHHGIRAVHLVGDISYANGASHVWDSYMHMIKPFATKVPLMVAVGNHEYGHEEGGEGKDPSGVDTPGGYFPDNASGGECGVPVTRRFSAPDTGNGVFWYSYDYGSTHIVVISSEHDIAPSSPQYQWLEGDLKKVDKAKTPWVIVENHRPMYAPSEKLEDSFVNSARADLEHLLFDFKVDLFFAGHFHLYVRSCPGLYQLKCNNGGPTYIIVGTGGKPLHKKKHDYAEDWIESEISEWGYGRVSVANSSALHWEFVSSSDGGVRDEMWLWKNDERSIDMNTANT